jgi:DNA-binding CsgD family transcriptional regulator
VKNYITNILSKLGAKKQDSTVSIAKKIGLIE